jgi:flavin-dependent dehydrogenase
LVRADIVIVGGGPAGSAAAVACARQGLQTVVVERAFPRSRQGESLHPGVESLLSRLGMADAVRGARFLRHRGHYVEWAGPRQFVTYGADQTGTWEGYQVDRGEFDRLLQRRAELEGARIFRCRALSPLIAEGRVNGVLTSEGPVRSSFVLDAAGGSHWLARRIGLHIRRFSPRLVAWHGYFEGSYPARDEAPALVADHSGWTWTARIRPRLYHWTGLPFRLATGRPPASPREFVGLRMIGRRRGVDVTWRTVQPAAGPGFFMLGDAAAVLDPLAGHGVLRALVSGMLASAFIRRVLVGAMTDSEASRSYNAWVNRWVDHDVTNLVDRYAGLAKFLVPKQHLRAGRTDADDLV